MRTLAIALLVVPLVACVAAPAEASWTKPRSLPDSTGVSGAPRVAIGLNGTVAVAFVRQGVRVAVRRGVGQIAPTTLVSSDRRAVSSPDIAISGRGDIIVVWAEARTRLPLKAPFRVRAITYVPKRGWGRPRTLGETAYFDTAQPRIRANARGDAAVAWRCSREVTPGVAGDAVCVTVRRTGHQFATVRALAEPAGTRAVLDQQVAVGAKGSVHVAWTRLPGPVIGYAYYGAARRWSTPSTLSALPASRPQLAAAADGSLVVAWREAPVMSPTSAPTYGPLVAIVRSPSGAFSEPQRIATQPIYEPEIAAAPSGEVLLAWSTPRDVSSGVPGASSVHWATRPPRATRFGGVDAVGLVDGSPSYAPNGRLGYSATGEALLAAGGPSGVNVVTRPAGGRFGRVESIDRDGDVPQLVTRRNYAAVVYAAEGRDGAQRLLISVRR